MRLLAGVVAALLLAVPAMGQSLDARSATPLRAGNNHGTIDNQTGAQFWEFHFRPGAGAIAVSFTSMGIFGNPMACTVNVVVMTPAGKIIGHQQLTSRGQPAQLSWPGKFDHAGEWIIEIQPMSSNIVRNGGDYSINVSGPAIAFGADAGPSPAEIAGTYAVMVCPPDFQCDRGLAIRFAPDGGVVTTDGHAGRWTLFDPDARIYSVVIGRDRWSLKLVPGRGLMDTHDQSIVVFQAIRR
ncbi:MAG TPA: hypothetical protein VHW60_14645 [Caulobacteraceae bacterium]|jgi:hypothetical protein|nr:hypothetical protein [Caulobacteraceae bacterium]